MADQPYNVLFLCTGNSARSILGEALMNKMGGGRFRAYIAGSQPKGDVHPMSLEVLDSFGYPTDGLRSKNCTMLSVSAAGVLPLSSSNISPASRLMTNISSCVKSCLSTRKPKISKCAICPGVSNGFLLSSFCL